MKKRKLMIVVEETGIQEPDGAGFIVYLEGDKERIGKIPKEQLGTAEFWGSELFRICGEAIKASGALRSVHGRGEKNSGH